MQAPDLWTSPGPGLHILGRRSRCGKCRELKSKPSTCMALHSILRLPCAYASLTPCVLCCSRRQPANVTDLRHRGAAGAGAGPRWKQRAPGTCGCVHAWIHACVCECMRACGCVHGWVGTVVGCLYAHSARGHGWCRQGLHCSVHAHRPGAWKRPAGTIQTTAGRRMQRVIDP